PPDRTTLYPGIVSPCAYARSRAAASTSLAHEVTRFSRGSTRPISTGVSVGGSTGEGSASPVMSPKSRRVAHSVRGRHTPARGHHRHAPSEGPYGAHGSYSAFRAAGIATSRRHMSSSATVRVSWLMLSTRGW